MVGWLEKRVWLSWIIVIAIAILIFYVSSLTGGQTGSGTPLKAILYHIIVFFALSFFLFIAVVAGKRRKLIPLVLSLAILYAILDELHQYFVPGRASAISDLLLNSIGILFAFLLYGIILEYRR